MPKMRQKVSGKFPLLLQMPEESQAVAKTKQEKNRWWLSLKYKKTTPLLRGFCFAASNSTGGLLFYGRGRCVNSVADSLSLFSDFHQSRKKLVYGGGGFLFFLGRFCLLNLFVFFVHFTPSFTITFLDSLQI